MIETRDFDILSPGFHANPFPTLTACEPKARLFA